MFLKRDQNDKHKYNNKKVRAKIRNNNVRRRQQQ
jgi:hypothetical protein